MRITCLCISLLGLASGLACEHKHEIWPPASAPSETAPDRIDSGDPTVRGNAPNSDPATDQSILARTVIPTGGAPGLGNPSGIGGSLAGSGGFGMGGVAGSRPVSYH
jgi:hypothetical protein